MMMDVLASDANIRAMQRKGRTEVGVRTTLDIVVDVLLATKEIAQQRGLSMGRVLSDLARQTLTRRTAGSVRQEVPLFPVRPDGGVVSLELVNQLRDESP